MQDATQDHPLIVKKERSASIGDGTPPKVAHIQRPRKNSLPTYDKAKAHKSEIDLLEGKKIVSKIPHVALLRKGEITILVPRGDLYLTNYELIYKPNVSTFKKHGIYYVQKNNSSSSLYNHATTIQQHILRNMACEEIRVPLMSINFCRKKSNHDNLKVKTYDMRELRFTFSLVESEPPKFILSALQHATHLLLPSDTPSNSSDQDFDAGDVDLSSSLSSSLSSLHSSFRAIGKPLMANGYTSLNLSQREGERGKGEAGGGLSGAKVAEKVFDYIMRFTNLQGSSDLFAFRYKLLPAPDQQMDGWFIYDPIKEFSRMGVPDTGWTISGVNNSYELCPTYPPLFSFLLFFSFFLFFTFRFLFLFILFMLFVLFLFLF
jgi:hypothetical protein